MASSGSSSSSSPSVRQNSHATYTEDDDVVGSPASEISLGFVDEPAQDYFSFSDTPEARRLTLAAIRRRFSDSRKATLVRALLQEDINPQVQAESTPLLPEAPHRQRNSDGARLFVFRRFLACSYLNFMVPVVPLAILAALFEWSPTTIFVLNLLAIVPLTGFVQHMYENLFVDLHLVLSYIFMVVADSTVDLIIIVTAVVSGEPKLALSFIAGAIISSILLGFGLCTFTGGIFHKTLSLKAKFSIVAPVLSVSCILLGFPTIAAEFHPHEPGSEHSTLELSYATAVILFIIFLMSMLYMLHTEIFWRVDASPTDLPNDEPPREESVWTHVFAYATSLVILLGLVLLIAIHVRLAMQTVGEVAESGAVSRALVGVILLPLVANMQLIVLCCIVAVKGEFELVSQVVLAENIRTATVSAPFLVLLGVIVGTPIKLEFTTTEVVVMMIAVSLLMILSRNLKTHYLDGLLCLGLYAISVFAICLRGDL